MYIPLDTMTISVRYVHLYLLTQSDEKRHVCMSLHDLGERIGIHHNTAYSILKKLRQTGHIEVLYRDSRQGNTYRIYEDSEAYEKSLKEKRLEKRGYYGY